MKSARLSTAVTSLAFAEGNAWEQRSAQHQRAARMMICHTCMICDASIACPPSLAMRGSGYIGKPRLPGAERRRLRHRLHLANGNATTDYGSDSIDFDCEQRMRAVQRAAPARSAQDDMSYLHGM